MQMLQVLQNFQNVVGVAVLLKCCKCCSVLKNCCKDFQKKNVANAGEVFECCRDVNKRCKWGRFPKILGEFALLHSCVELIETICSLLCHLSFAVAVLSCNCGWPFAQHKLGS